jgi:GTP-binding protein EngB required for normal cell division
MMAGKLAKTMKTKSHRLGESKIYQLPQNEVQIPDTTTIRKFEIGESPKSHKVIQHKVVMIMGATGTGKSTLINAMVNHVLGVKWEGDFRFKLIVDEVASQTKSVTQSITVYTIHVMAGARIPYTLTVVDTPGFEDTEGLERDKETVKQLKEFFSLKDGNGIDHLDAIGFVTPAPCVRLTHAQHYVYTSVLDIFGKDVKNNIFAMITFCDNHKPLAIAAIQEAQIPCSMFLKFNNSSLYAPTVDDSGNEDYFSKHYWTMGEKSFSDFFSKLASKQSVSISLTKKVLANREKLETTLEKLQKQIDDCVEKSIKVPEHKDKVTNDQDDLTSCDQAHEIQAELTSKIAEACSCLDILQAIALTPTSMSLTEYIELMILTEEREGSNIRKAYLTKCKEYVSQLETIASDKERSVEDLIEEERSDRAPGWEERMKKLLIVKRMNEKVSEKMSEKKSWFTTMSEGVKLIGRGVMALFGMN